MIKSICIVRLSALGDVLMLVPLVRTLQANFPEATITWVISKPAYFLVEGMEGIEFIVIDKPKSMRDYWRFYQTMRGRTFDVLLATQASLRANLLYPLIRAARKIGYDAHRARDGHGFVVRETIAPGFDHTLDGFLKFADVLAVKKKVLSWDLPITKEDMDWAVQQLPTTTDPIVIINPAASKPERSWLVERYIEVIQHLQSRFQAQVVLTGGPGDDDKRFGAAISREVDVINLIGQTKPKQLLAVISKARLVICPDTGPAHMASAVGTPVIALHAVTNPNISGPYTFRHLAVDHYPEAVAQLLNIDPKTPHWGTQVHDDKAMGLIGVSVVLEKLDAFFTYQSTSIASSKS